MAEVETIDIKIPNLGEAESTEIIEVNIKAGDKVNINDPLIVLESEKAAMEVPSDFNGEITEVFVKEGDSVDEGMLFAQIKAEPKKKSKAQPKEIQSSNIEENDVKPQKTLNEIIDISGVNAGPAVRKYARELEIDLTKIKGSGKNQRVTKEDLKNFIHSAKNINNFLTFSEGDFKDQGSYSIEKLTKIRALGAKNLHNSWVSIPHVTHFEDVNLKALNDIRVETKYSLLAYFVYALSQTLKEFPYFNASLISKDEVLLKDYINIGIAVDTEMGLVVPVLKDADKKNVQQISEEINFLAEKARERKLFEKDLVGSTFTISSLGKIGGTGFTPIINPPEVAIVSLSRSKKILQLVDNIPVEIEILPFGLSYDHRVINGADAGRFCYHLKSLIESIS